MNLTRSFTCRIKLLALAVGLIASLTVIHFTGLQARAARFTSSLAERMNGESARRRLRLAANVESPAPSMATSQTPPIVGCGAKFAQTPDSPISVGGFPASVAMGDFNLDGKTDLAVANEASSNVTILLGNGSGGFIQPAGSPVAAGTRPESVAVGDFNSDGKPDLAVANRISNDVTILLGNGSGGYTQAAGSPVAAGAGAFFVVVGDFDLDGKPDLAVANRNSDNVTILLGNGSGGFTPAAGSPVSAGDDPFSVAVGDFNLDGKPDIATANHGSNDVTILLGNGNGGFTQAAGSPVGAGLGPISVVAGDFNLDGKPDLATANYLSASVTILLGNGNGGFTQPAGSPVNSGLESASLAIGDFNLDGKTDLAVVSYIYSSVAILFGDGQGHFTDRSVASVATGRLPTFIVVGDINLDGKPDFVTANLDSNSVTVQLNTCDALPCGGIAFSKASSAPSALFGFPVQEAVGDFNLDGKPDLAVVSNYSYNVVILLGNGNGGFSQLLTVPPVGLLDRLRSLAIGDFNLDGKPDLAVTTDNSNVVILLGNGLGGFTQAADSPIGLGDYSNSVVVGDFNLDGKPDLAVANLVRNNVTILLGDGSGRFTQPTGSPISVGTSPFALAIRDFNLDGKPDLAVANANSDNVMILLGNGSGGFTQAASLPVGLYGFPRYVVAGDLNLDGKPDLIVVNANSSKLVILLGNGSGGFIQAVGSPISVQGGAGSVTLGDFNLDGKPDLAVAVSSNSVAILQGNGSGGFSPAASVPVGPPSHPSFVVVGDFNRDGRPDFAVANYGSLYYELGNIEILLNTCPSHEISNPPTITGMLIFRNADDSSANLQIATVGSALAAPNTLSVKVNGGTSATVNGVSVSNLTVDAVGVVNADVVVAANAANANFTLRVTDSRGLFTETTLSVFVFGFSVKLADPAVCLGPGGVIGVTVQLRSPITPGIVGTANFIATLAPNLLAMPGTCAASLGNCKVDIVNNKITWNATLIGGQTAVINYQAQVADVAPTGEELCITSIANFDEIQSILVTACTKANCPAVGPGALPLAASPVSDQKAGSVLVYNLYTSGATGNNAQNARIALTNTHPGLSTPVHLFFVDGSSCSVADSYICLTPNQTTTFLAADVDPGTTGYIVAIAVDSDGCPRNFNYLIGDEYVKLTSGHAANLGAEAFSALAGGPPLCGANSTTAVLNFDGASYNRAPRVLAVDNIPSKADGNETQLILNRFGGNLGTGAETLGAIFGVLYNDAEASLSFSVNGSCQLRSSLSNNFPRTVPRFEEFIPAGRSGWMKLYSQNDLGILGVVINFNANAGAQANAFNQGHNLHKLTLTPSAVLIIPVFPPSC